jgi:dihydroorotase
VPHVVAAGLELVRQAKSEGLPVTCDVGVHHMHL